MKLFTYIQDQELEWFWIEQQYWKLEDKENTDYKIKNNATTTGGPISGSKIREIKLCSWCSLRN